MRVDFFGRTTLTAFLLSGLLAIGEPPGVSEYGRAVAQSPGKESVLTPPLPAPPPILVPTDPVPPPPTPTPEEFVLTPIDNDPVDSTFTRVAVPVGRKILIAAQGAVITETKRTAWRIYPPNPDATLESNSHVVSFVADTPGRYWLVSSVSGTDAASEPLMKTILVEVGSLPPTPPGPMPPGPNPPGPVPPDVDPAPVAKEGFRALLLYDSVAGLPAVFASTEIRTLLNTYCVKGDDNKTPDWRCWDETVDPEGDFPVWADYRKAVPAGEKFYIVLGDGKRGFAGVPPNTIAELKALILKYSKKQ